MYLSAGCMRADALLNEPIETEWLLAVWRASCLFVFQAAWDAATLP